MIQSLELGCAYDLTIYSTIYPSNVRQTAWNLERHKLPLYPPVPRRGRQMTGAFGDDHPWSAVVAACHLLTKSIAPDGTYMNLCMGLVLSLASIQQEDEGCPLQILAVGHDSTKLNAIMEKASRFATRLVKLLIKYYYYAFTDRQKSVDNKLRALGFFKMFYHFSFFICCLSWKNNISFNNDIQK